MTKIDGRFSTVIRVSVRDKFFNETKKGELINNLLEKHYGSDLMTKEERAELFKETNPINREPRDTEIRLRKGV